MVISSTSRQREGCVGSTEIREWRRHSGEEGRDVEEVRLRVMEEMERRVWLYRDYEENLT